MKFWKRKGFKKIATGALRAGAAWSTGGTSELYLAKAQGLQKMFRGGGGGRGGGGAMPGGAPIGGQNFDFQPSAPRQFMERQVGRMGGAKPWWIR